MWRRTSLTRWGRANVLLSLMAFMVVLSVASCGGQGGDQEAASEERTVKGENAETGKSLEGEIWKVTLVDAPEQMKVISGDIATDDPVGVAQYIPGFVTDRRHLTKDMITAAGIYVMVPVEISNISDEPQMVTRAMLKIVDAEGQEHVFAQNLQHLVCVWINERWMDDSHLIVPSVPDAGEVREGPLLFDVPEDATGLKLVMEGSDESIDLGF